MMNKVEEQICETKNIIENTKDTYEVWTNDQKQKNEDILKEIAEKELELKTNEEKLQEMEKQLNKLSTEKESLKS